jgi:hypothetical protein
MSFRASAFLFLLVSAAGCAANDDAPARVANGDENVAEAGGDAENAALPVEGGWCARIAGGAGVDGVSPPIALSEAHAWVRYFGAASSHEEVDGALVDGVTAANGAVDERAAAGFGTALESVCFVAASERALDDAKVTTRGGLAIVKPGRGDVVVPNDATAIALDLRDVPGTQEGAQAIASAVAALIAQPIATLNERVQVRVGFTDEAFNESGLYQAALESKPIASPAPRATTQKPLAVIVGKTIAPAGARIALALRAAGRAWLLGEDLDVAVAETRWTATGKTRGLAYRVSDVLDASGRRFGDVIAADGAADDATLDGLATRGAPPALATTAATRAAIEARQGFGETQSLPVNVATARAALVSAHGAAKLFFPYFGTIPDVTDARLLETLESASTVTDRASMRVLLRRFGHALADGHNWVIDGGARGAGILPVMLDRASGLPVVSRTYDAKLNAGDTLLAIDGMDSAAWFQREMGRTYGATEGHRFVTAASELTQTSPPKTLRVKAPSGAERDVTVAPVAFNALPRGADLFAGSTRKRGWLADLGAPDVYYFNLDGAHVDGDADMIAGLGEAASARAVVLDMRGHPATAPPFR